MPLMLPDADADAAFALMMPPLRHFLMPLPYAAADDDYALIRFDAAAIFRHAPLRCEACRRSLSIYVDASFLPRAQSRR